MIMARIEAAMAAAVVGRKCLNRPPWAISVNLYYHEVKRSMHPQAIHHQMRKDGG
jgi:hypothetical protein